MSSTPNCSYIDIHSHVLYGLDDGAETVEDSQAMLEMAARGGTTDIVATPHSDLTYQFQPDLVEQRVSELNHLMSGKIRVHRGCDFHLHFDNIQDCLANPTKYTINHLRFLLVEFHDLHIPDTISEVFKRMVDLEITPIITHPERNPLLQQRLEDLAAWVREGCLIQVTAQSYLDRFGKRARKTADDLLARKMVHFVASDAHGIDDRTPLLSEAYAYIAQSYGETQARALFHDHPAATLTGRYLEVEDPAPPKKKSWFW